VVSIVTGNGLKDVASAQKAAGLTMPGKDDSGDGGPLIRIPPLMDLLAVELGKRGVGS